MQNMSPKKQKLYKLLGFIVLAIMLWQCVCFIMHQADPIVVTNANFQDAKILYEQGEYANSVQILEPTLSHLVTNAPNSPDHLVVLAILCDAYVELAEFQKAEKRCQEAQRMSDKLYGTQSTQSRQMAVIINTLNARRAASTSAN